MQPHTLNPTHKKKRSQRVGRGGKRGSYSGRGIKGQKSRAGRRIRPEVRDLIKKIPKQKGYRHQNRPKHEVAIKAVVIAKKFKQGEVVTPKLLVKRGLVRRLKGKTPMIKIVSPGNFLNGLIVKGCSVSRQS